MNELETLWMFLALVTFVLGYVIIFLDDKIHKLKKEIKEIKDVGREG